MEHKKDLFDLLCEKTGCEYLSEMKELQHRERLLQAIRETGIDAYPYREWAAAFAYLFHEDDMRIDSEKAFFEYLAGKGDSRTGYSGNPHEAMIK